MTYTKEQIRAARVKVEIIEQIAADGLVDELLALVALRVKGQFTGAKDERTAAAPILVKAAALAAVRSFTFGWQSDSLDLPAQVIQAAGVADDVCEFLSDGLRAEIAKVFSRAAREALLRGCEDD